MLSAHLTSSIIAIDIAVRMTAFLTLNDFAFKMLRDASVIIGPGRGGAPIVTTTTPPAASSTASTLTATRNTRRGGSVLHSSVGTAGSGGSDRDVEDEEEDEKDGAYLHDASWWLNHVHDSCGSSSQSKKKRQKLAGAPKLSTSTRTSSEGPRGPAGGSRGNAGAMRGGSRAGDGEGKSGVVGEGEGAVNGTVDGTGGGKEDEGGGPASTRAAPSSVCQHVQACLRGLGLDDRLYPSDVPVNAPLTKAPGTKLGWGTSGDGGGGGGIGGGGRDRGAVFSPTPRERRLPIGCKTIAMVAVCSTGGNTRGGRDDAHSANTSPPAHTVTTRPVVCILRQECRLDMDAVREACGGGAVTLVPRDEVAGWCGFPVGGVGPVGLRLQSADVGVLTLIDRELVEGLAWPLRRARAV